MHGERIWMLLERVGCFWSLSEAIADNVSATCTPAATQHCLDATATQCSPYVRVWGSSLCCPSTLPVCTSHEGYGTGCFPSGIERIPTPPAVLKHRGEFVEIASTPPDPVVTITTADRVLVPIVADVSGQVQSRIRHTI